MKKYRNLTGIVFLVWIIFLYNFLWNEKLIGFYVDKEYKRCNFEKQIPFDFLERYVADYNQGNVCYKQENYEEAIVYYKKALSKNPKQPKDCEIRINLCLSMIALLDYSDRSEENQTQITETLKEAIVLLTEHGCAKEDMSGHNEDAQQLKQEIEAYLNQNSQEMSESSSKDQSENSQEETSETETSESETSSDEETSESETSETETSETETSEAETSETELSESEKEMQQKEEQLKELQQESNGQRQQDMLDTMELEQLFSGDVYYDGKKW